MAEELKKRVCDVKRQEGKLASECGHLRTVYVRILELNLRGFDPLGPSLDSVDPMPRKDFAPPEHVTNPSYRLRHRCDVPPAAAPHAPATSGRPDVFLTSPEGGAVCSTPSLL